MKATFTIEYQNPSKTNGYNNTTKMVKAAVIINDVSIYAHSAHKTNPFFDKELITPYDAMGRYLELKRLLPELEINRLFN